VLFFCGQCISDKYIYIVYIGDASAITISFGNFSTKIYIVNVIFFNLLLAVFYLYFIIIFLSSLFLGLRILGHLPLIQLAIFDMLVY